jgi:hypothetical protein
MEPTLTIQFGKSNSKIFEQVIKLVAGFEGYSFNDNVHRVTFSREKLMREWERFYEIYGLTCNWKSFALFINNIKIPGDKANMLVTKIREVKICFSNFLIYKRKHLYCNKSAFGCLNIKSINLNPDTYGNYWYLYGHFEDNASKWVVHKKEIKMVIQEEISRKQLCFCPVFNTGKIEEVINSFPDVIDLKKGNKNWHIIYENRFSGSKIIRVPVRIEHIVEDEPVEDLTDWFVIEHDGEEIEWKEPAKSNPFEKDTDDWTNWEIDNFLNSVSPSEGL